MATLLFTVAHALGVGVGNLMAVRLEEEVELAVKVMLDNTKIPLKKEKKLFFHQVDLVAVEAKNISVVLNAGVVGPVLILGRRVVEILGGENERSEKDAMGGASKAASHGLELGL